MTLPPYIANAPTPRTDKHWEENRVLDRGCYISKGFATQLERELIYAREVMELLKLALLPFGSGVNPIPLGKIKARLDVPTAKLINSFNYKANEALAAYEQFKKDTKL